MKSTFIFALLALGTLICATKAAPSSSEMQQDDGDMKKLLELIDRAARSQQGDDDGDEKDSNAELQDADDAELQESNDITKSLQAEQQDGDLMAELESLPEEAQAQFLSALLGYGLSRLLG